MRGVIQNGTGRGIGISGIQNQAAKTGTINSNRAVWFNGYTPEVAGAAMIAVDPTTSRFRNQNRGLKGFYIKSSGINLQGHGSTDAGRLIWRPAMTAAMKGRPDVSFHSPPGTILNGQQTTVPYVGNLPIADARNQLRQAGFNVATQYGYSTAPRYTFLGWSPDSGQSIPQFGTVYELRSGGPDPTIAQGQPQATGKPKR